MTSAARLDERIAALGLNIPIAIRTKLLAYAALMLKWNKVYNLTAIRDEAQIIDLHLIDSLTVLPYIKFDRLADIGAGAGLPGLALAIVQPALQVELVDAVDKKCIFMRQAAAELGLKNVQIHHVRVEGWRPNALFPAIISRAFAELADFVRLTERILAPDGYWLAMKGVYPAEEIARLPAGVQATESIPLVLPGVDVSRYLIVINRI
ncbi:MAG TPA: 16S rRNA (guanine(527)-N(7))-methyltransferase RsmG [Rhodocyclaceae bacterium]|nr:16S rRNA (guanine(527)-N(7))-methyltransferase RsmG [Rhodocyclaceae bacterium]